jgi:hypothetical protein
VPPGWGGGGGGGTAVGGSWGPWQSGTEVLYSATPAQAAGQAGEELPVSVTERRVTMQLYDKPFAQGGMRKAIYAR